LKTDSRNTHTAGRYNVRLGAVMIAKRRERLKDRERLKIIILIKMVGEVFFKIFFFFFF
jgi:hypothetical protein